MEIRIIDEGMRQQWDGYVMSCPHTVAWHSYNWQRTVSACYEADFLPLAAIENKEITGIFPLYRLLKGPTSSSLISIPFAVAGGIASDKAEVEEALLQYSIHLLNERGLSRLILKQYKKKISGQLLTDDSYCNRELMLHSDSGRIWSEISEHNRQRIDQTRKMNVTVDYPSREVDVFYAMLTRHQRDTGIPGPSPRWIKALLDLGMYEVALLKREGRPLVGTLAKRFKDTVSFPYTCLNHQDSEHVNLACRLYWELITGCAHSGTNIFHSGRLPRAGEANDYRLGWGGVEYGYYYQYYPAVGGATESSQKRGRKRDLLKAFWKLLPLPLSRAAGPIIVRRFP